MRHLTAKPIMLRFNGERIYRGAYITRGTGKAGDAIWTAEFTRFTGTDFRHFEKRTHSFDTQREAKAWVDTLAAAKPKRTFTIVDCESRALLATVRAANTTEAIHFAMRALKRHDLLLYDGLDTIGAEELDEYLREYASA